jgi:L-fuculose-phosphate aldolase
MTKRQKIEKIKNDIVVIAKLMYDKGLVNAYEGNISVRFDDTVYVTPSAECKGFLTSDMLVITDMEGTVLEGQCKPSSEIKLHLAAYKLRGDLKAVIHSHSPYATAYAVANKPIISNAYPEMITFFGQIPLAEYGTPGTDTVFAGLHKYINEFDVVLLANHGVVAVGTDIWDTYFRIEAAESIAKTLLLAEQAGGAVDLPKGETDRITRSRISSRSS